MANKDSTKHKFTSISEIKHTYLAKQTLREARHSDSTSSPLTSVELLQKIGASHGSQKSKTGA
jgi:hypothetical protein